VLPPTNPGPVTNEDAPTPRVSGVAEQPSRTETASRATAASDGRAAMDQTAAQDGSGGRDSSGGKDSSGEKDSSGGKDSSAGRARAGTKASGAADDELALPPPGTSPAATAPTSTGPAARMPASERAPAARSASGWHLDGLVLGSVAPPPSGHGGSPAFRQALRASLRDRPVGARPGTAALRRWSASLKKAAAVAPDAQTRKQLRIIARYAAELSRTPAPERAGLQSKRPGVVDAAAALRVTLPRRFGVSLLG
jgi:hypothetical protein